MPIAIWKGETCSRLATSVDRMQFTVRIVRSRRLYSVNIV